MKIMFNRPTKREAWGGGSHFITGLYEYFSLLGHDIVFSLCEGIDVIFMFDPRPESGGDSANDIYQYKLEYPSVKIIQRINDTDIARPADRPWRVQMILESNIIADHTVFISEWVKDHYTNRGFDSSKSNTVIINGCNPDWYFPIENKSLNHKKISLITHHWSDNFMKGFDVYNFLDKFVEENDRFSFTYMGRYNKDYTPTHTNMIPPHYGPRVGEILRDHDIYVTAARFEACGMHHIEAARSGLPVLYHADGGAIPEVCKNHGVEFSCLNGFKEALDKIILEYDNFLDNIDYNFLSSERCFEQ